MSIARRTIPLLILCLLAASAWGRGPTPTEFVPGAASVQRFGTAYRYPQAGWIVVHVEGEPYERGYQHGKLLAPEIADYVKTLATARSPKAPADGWKAQRLLVDALFLRRYDREFLEEMKGIADGAAAGGAKFEGRALDLIDIVALNSGIEVDFLEDNLRATPTGLEGRRFREPPAARPAHKAPEHCSAFAAVGPATADGKIVFGHITMWGLYHVRHFNVWLDIRPAKGHRVLMQTFPGGVMSGLDYYINDAGILLAETTIRQTRFDITGSSLVSRVRQAIQYGSTIDDVVKTLQTANNGSYSNEWIMADTKRNEIALFELGTHKSRLWRSSRGEWFGGTEGFYWGCNNAKDLKVRLETIPSVEGKPANVVFAPSDRDQAWLALYRKHRGKITADFGFEAFTTAPLVGFPSCDAKFTTTDLARDLKSWALFGPPRGRTWGPTAEERSRYSDIRPLVSNDWALVSGRAPADTKEPTAGDVAGKLATFEPLKDEDGGTLPAAWHGTILPQTDADVWLAAAFADYEKIVALEKSLKEQAKDGRLDDDDKRRLAVALYEPRSRYLAAVRRLGRDVPLAETRREDKSDLWYHQAAGKGVLLLAELRRALGEERFDRMMDDFGRAHAGKPVTTSALRQAAEKVAGKSLASLFDPYLVGTPQLPAGGTWAINSFESEPERTLIVYGTLKEASAQKEAAQLLQHKIARRWCNFDVPIKADTEVTSDDLARHHLLVIGRPDTNAVARDHARSLPVRFGSGSFALRGVTYAHPGSAVIVAGDNPASPRYSLVLFAGLGAESTWHSVQRIPDDERTPGLGADAVLMAAGEAPKPMVASVGAVRVMPK